MSCYHRLKEITIYQTEQYHSCNCEKRNQRGSKENVYDGLGHSFTSTWLWVALYYLIRVYKNQSSS